MKEKVLIVDADAAAGENLKELLIECGVKEKKLI